MGSQCRDYETVRAINRLIALYLERSLTYRTERGLTYCPPDRKCLFWPLTCQGTACYNRIPYLAGDFVEQLQTVEFRNLSS